MSVINFQERADFGTSFARRLRKQDLIPVSIFDGDTAVQASADLKDVQTMLQDNGIKVHKVNVGSKSYSVIIYDVQRDPITSDTKHINFLSIDNRERVKVKIPIDFTNKEICPGIKKGGIINFSARKIEVEVDSKNIPFSFVCDLSSYEVDQAISLKEFNIPADVKVFGFKPDSTIATIVAPSKPK